MKTKKKMNIWIPVTLVTAYLFIYTSITAFSENTAIAYLLFAFSPVFLIWMVVRVLKDGTPSGRTFDTYYYDDVDKRSDL
jgi:hypothetical protein